MTISTITRPCTTTGRRKPSCSTTSTDEGFAVLNADDAGSAGLPAHLDCPTLTVGIRHAAEITALPLEQCTSEQTFLLTAGSETVPVRTEMIGTHHIYNCLAAAAVGLAYGIELTTVVRGLESVDYVPGRLERIECGQPFGVFVDFAHTPDALTGVLAGPAASDLRAADLRVRRRRRARSPEAAADGPGRRARRRSGHPHQRQSAPRRPVGHHPRRARRFPWRPAAVEVIPDRAAAIHRALAMARAGRLRVDRRQRARNAIRSSATSVCRWMTARWPASGCTWR